VRLGITYMQASYNLRGCSTLVLELYSRTSKGLSVGELVGGPLLLFLTTNSQIKSTQMNAKLRIRAYN
jgi:hypothetical protein